MSRKKSKSIRKDVDVNPYHIRLVIIISGDPQFECAKLNQQYKGLEFKWEDTASAMTHGVHNGHIFVVFNSKDKKDIGNIAHESVHIVNLVMAHSGVKYQVDNDEPFAYLTSWVADQISQSWTA